IRSLTKGAAMPFVLVSTTSQYFLDDFYEQLKHVLRETLAEVLTVPEIEGARGITLYPHDFSFQFHWNGEHDEPIADLEIIVLAHDDVCGYRADLDDTLAEVITDSLKRLIMDCRHLVLKKGTLSFCAAVHLGKMSYYKRALIVGPRVLSF